MGKSQCEQELEAMRAERDHWKRIAQEHEGIIQDLKDRLERSEMYADAFTSGAMSKLDERIKRLQAERNQLKKEAERLQSIFEIKQNLVLKMSRVAMESVEAHVTMIEEFIRELDDAVRNKTAISKLITEIVPSLTRLFAIAKNLTKPVISDSEHSDLMTLTNLTTAMGLFMGLALISAYITIFSQSLSAIADAILKECHEYNKPSDALIAMLPSSMFDKDGLFGDTTSQTLSVALETCSKWKAGGLSKEAFCQSAGLTTRRLRDYERYFERMEWLARRTTL